MELPTERRAGTVRRISAGPRGPDDPTTTPAPELLELNGREKEILLDRIARLAARVGYPVHKRKGLLLLFRRVLGRATPSEAEYRMMLGLFKSLERELGRSRS